MDRNWLDRFSGQSTPSGSPPPHSRSYSPTPKRPTHLGAPPALPSRPAYSPRSSSLSLGLSSNASTSSLPGGPRVPNGSALRQEISAAAPPNIVDPLAVLAEIIGQRTQSSRPSGGGDGSGKPVQIIEEIEFGDLSLQDFVEKNENNSAEAGTVTIVGTIVGDDCTCRHLPLLDLMSTNSFPRCKASREVRELTQCDCSMYTPRCAHETSLIVSLQGCDDVLGSVETYLASFQTELGAVSAEIETLQGRSFELNAKLDNRRKVEKLLGPAVEEISISPTVVREIAEGTIGDNWVKALLELESRLAAIDAKRDAPNQIKAVTDLKPLLEDLKNKVDALGPPVHWSMLT
jgi:vacuolar protein sorting-associated protein 52